MQSEKGKVQKEERAPRRPSHYEFFLFHFALPEGGAGGVEPHHLSLHRAACYRYTTCRTKRTASCLAVRVIPGGIEPPTSSVSGRRPEPLGHRIIVLRLGFEPRTPRSRRGMISVSPPKQSGGEGIRTLMPIGNRVSNSARQTVSVSRSVSGRLVLNDRRPRNEPQSAGRCSESAPSSHSTPTNQVEPQGVEP